MKEDFRTSLTSALRLRSAFQRTKRTNGEVSRFKSKRRYAMGIRGIQSAPNDEKKEEKQKVLSKGKSFCGFSLLLPLHPLLFKGSLPSDLCCADIANAYSESNEESALSDKKKSLHSESN